MEDKEYYDDLMNSGEIEDYQIINGSKTWKPIIDELYEMKNSNKLKTILNIGDIFISNTYGVGYIKEIENSECWYPIQIEFEQKILLFGEIQTKHKTCFYNTDGQTNSIGNSNDCTKIDGMFYKKI